MTRERLEAWIMKAYAAGLVAFDTETDALSIVDGRRTSCGVSLAVAPGEACYIPLGHEQELGGVRLRAPTSGAEQIAVEEALARLKPLLEDRRRSSGSPRTSSTISPSCRGTVSTWRRSTTPC